MPIYEYECEKCGERFELRRSINNSDSKIRCPKCETEKTQRVFSMFTTSSSSVACSPNCPT